MAGFTVPSASPSSGEELSPEPAGQGTAGTSDALRSPSPYVRSAKSRGFHVPSASSSPPDGDETSRHSADSRASRVPSASSSAGEDWHTARQSATPDPPGRRSSPSPTPSTRNAQDAGPDYVANREIDGQPVVDRVIRHQPRTQQIKRHTINAIADILGGHDNLVQLVQHAGFGTANTQRITTWQLTEGGSLADLINSRKPPATLPTEPFHGLLESFIWHTIVSLFKAITYLQTGNSDRQGEPEHPDWTPIVHNSINPSNIFYSTRAAGQEHEQCKLGNFSKCVILQGFETPETPEEREARIEAFHVIPEEEETGFEAPEIFSEEDHLPGLASDMWSIGAVAVAMMIGYNVWDLVRQTAFHAHEQRRPNTTSKLLETWRSMPAPQRHVLLQGQAMHAEIVSALPDYYSYGLKQFVEALLFFDPAYRGVTEVVLQDAIERYDTERNNGFNNVREPTEDEMLAKAIAESRASRHVMFDELPNAPPLAP